MLIYSGAVLAEPKQTAKAEIEHLFTYLKSSGCKFNRNGTWYSAGDAVNHLETKYNYLLDKGLIVTAQSFVERGATKSSMSGKPYLVQCGSSEAVESAAWFMAELARYRGGNANRASGEN